ncbi:hypothetical protein SEVIR_9G178700v4 [Setaria viridis]|uniref:Uncharacterized protein n=1 Tax=Setaria viridis TaxID=4556 RepID=A0A4U6SWM6_SETVI|nr:hypothetical protein SEVIR_9G178700v2 [Setaria viridis]
MKLMGRRRGGEKRRNFPPKGRPGHLRPRSRPPPNLEFASFQLVRRVSGLGGEGGTPAPSRYAYASWREPQTSRCGCSTECRGGTSSPATLLSGGARHLRCSETRGGRRTMFGLVICVTILLGDKQPVSPFQQCVLLCGD